MPSTGPTVKRFLRCPCCGMNVAHRAFSRGSLRHQLEAVTQRIVGRGYGTNGGPSIWSRRGMSREELERVGLAVATAAAVIADRLDGDLPDPRTDEEVLARLGEEELVQLADEWIAEASAEIERRRRVVAEEIMRRGRGSRRERRGA